MQNYYKVISFAWHHRVGEEVYREVDQAIVGVCLKLWTLVLDCSQA